MEDVSFESLSDLINIQIIIYKQNKVCIHIYIYIYIYIYICVCVCVCPYILSSF